MGALVAVAERYGLTLHMDRVAAVMAAHGVALGGAPAGGDDGQGQAAEGA